MAWNTVLSVSEHGLLYRSVAGADMEIFSKFRARNTAKLGSVELRMCL